MRRGNGVSFVGIDYIRVTSPDIRLYGEWSDIFLPEMLQAEKEGARPRMRGILGYYGQMTEHAFVGRGDAGAMAQASGAISNHYFRSVTSTGGKATRIDLQCTMQTGCPASEFIRYQFAALQERKRAAKRPKVVGLQDTNYGARMLTIGSRQSEVYGRIYDKFQESKMPEYEGMTRFEIEIKGHQARDMQVFLYEGGTEYHTSRHIVAGWFNREGVEHDFQQGELQEYIPMASRKRSDETRIAWFAAQVAPSVADMVTRGMEKEVARALMPIGASDEDIDRVAEAMLSSVMGGAKYS